MRIIEPSVELVWITPDAAKVIEMAARKCYASEDQYDPDRTNDFIDRVVHQRHHESVVEHASACFDFTTDRGVMAEITRHRLASFSIQSTRYCNYSKDKFGGEISIIKPPGLTEEQEYFWQMSVEHAEKAYFAMLVLGCAPQIARSVLPTCLATHIRMTANLREWGHVLKLRTDPAAHPQIREIAGRIQDILVEQVPQIFRKVSV